MAWTFMCISCARHEDRSSNIGRVLFCFDCAEQHSREAQRAISRVSDAVRLGKLQPPTDFDCVDCGAPAKQYDHRDYTKPLDVQPVCVPCNYRRGPALDSQMRAVLPVMADQDMEPA